MLCTFLLDTGCLPNASPGQGILKVGNIFDECFVDNEAVVSGVRLVINEEKVDAVVVASSEIGWGQCNS